MCLTDENSGKIITECIQIKNKSFMCLRNNQFGRGTQEDSYELLNTLLSGIFDDINNSDNSKLITKRG